MDNCYVSFGVFGFIIVIVYALFHKPTPEEQEKLERYRQERLRRSRTTTDEEEDWIAYVTALDMDEYFDDF